MPKRPACAVNCCRAACWGHQSADYDPHHPGTVRRDGSFIYEEFLTTGGTDVKVYTVGPRCVQRPQTCSVLHVPFDGMAHKTQTEVHQF
jgi:hypothetical protein